MKKLLTQTWAKNMKKLKDLKENECIKVNTLKEAKFIKKHAKNITIPARVMVDEYIYSSGNTLWCGDEIHNNNYTVHPASDFIKPKKSTKKIIKELKQEVARLENEVCDIKKMLPDTVIKIEVEKSKFERGEWYRQSEGDNYIICITGEDTLGVSGYGLCDGDWFNDGYRYSKDLIKISDKETEKALIKEANKQGFKDGVVFERLEGAGKALCEGKMYWHDNDGCPALFYGGIAIMQYGKWAEIVSHPEQEDKIDWSIKGQLFYDDGLVVISNGEHTEEGFTGTVVSEGNNHVKGQIITYWNKEVFKPYKGSICLKND